MAQIAVMRWYWCDKCQRHAYPSDIGFKPAPHENLMYSDDCEREIYLLYHCDCHRVWGVIPLVFGADGLLYPEYAPASVLP